MKFLYFFICWLSGNVVSNLAELWESKEESLKKPQEKYGPSYKNENILGRNFQNRYKDFEINALNPAIPEVAQYITEEIDKLQNTENKKKLDYKDHLSFAPHRIPDARNSHLTYTNDNSMKITKHRFLKPVHVIFNHSLLNYLRIDPTYNVLKAVKKDSFPDVRKRLPIGFIPDVQQQVQEVSNHYVQKHELIDSNSDIQKPVTIDPNRNVHELVVTDPNYNVQVQENVDFTHDFRKFNEHSFIDVPPKAVQINYAYLLPKDAQINAEHDLQSPVESYLKYNASKYIKLYHSNYNKVNVQSDIINNITKFFQLKHAPNFQIPVVNSSHNFPKRSRSQDISQFVLQYKHSHGFPRREILKFQEKDLKAVTSVLKFFLKLSEQENENQTDNSGKEFQLGTIRQIKKRETVLKVPNNDVTQTNHKTKEPLTNNQTNNETFNIGKRSEFGRTYEIPKFRPSSIQYFVQFTPVRKLKKHANVMSSSGEKNITKTVTFNKDCYAHEPFQVYLPHNLRDSVQLDSSHNMRKPVHLNPFHSIRTPVKLNPTHNLQKPVQVDPNHDLRKPVKLEPDHNLRKPVKSMESHDLRWPILEEPDHNMRNPTPQIDAFSKGEAVEKLEGNIHKGSKTSVIDDPLYELLYEDEFLMLACSRDQVTFNDNAFSSGANTASKYDYKRLFNESFKACGIPANHLKEEVFRKERKSIKWPWMVSLQQHIFDRFWHKCAGSLLNNLWVITAAHCVESRPKWDFLLQLGMDEESLNYIERFVDRMSIHPKFNILNLDHDIALLRMNNPVDFHASIAPICLPWRPDEIENKKAVALGWKIASKRNVTDDLSREKTVPVLTNKECEVMFSETGSSESIQKSFLCASFENEHEDSCVGDSGGPLVILDGTGRWILAGLYSWGKSCRTPNQPEVYIRISRYAEWIEDTISCYEENINLQRMD